MICLLPLLKTDGRHKTISLRAAEYAEVDYISIYVYAKLNMNVSLP